jgi:L-histidine N-alpha-methyltransferase
MRAKKILSQLEKARENGENVVIRAPGMEGWGDGEFAQSVVEGLGDNPKWLDCSYLYDQRGSELFELISQQPEYYLTRTEIEILRRHAREISTLTGEVNLVELGSGYSVKTRHILSAYLAALDDPHYVPVDVSAAALHAARRTIAETHPEVQFSGVIGTYESAMPLLPELSPAMVIFLGSTIGNMDEAQASAFFADLAQHMEAGDHVLLGVDLVKDHAILEAAYNDAAGVTAEFTLNIFERMNRELGSEIDIAQVEHVARYNPERKCIETFAEFHTGQVIEVEPLQQSFMVSSGERIAIEISRKFDLDELVPALLSHGLETRHVYTDPQGWFAVLLLQVAAR